MFRKLALSFAVAAGLTLPLADSASAGVAVGAFAAPAALAETAPVETVAYVYGGRNYCYYEAGWKGPGWYWCGYAYRTGYGWGAAPMAGAAGTTLARAPPMGPAIGTAPTTEPMPAIGTAPTTALMPAIGTALTTEPMPATGTAHMWGITGRVQVTGAAIMAQEQVTAAGIMERARATGAGITAAAAVDAADVHPGEERFDAGRSSSPGATTAASAPSP